MNIFSQIWHSLLDRQKRFANRTDNVITRNSKQLARLGKRLQQDDCDIKAKWCDHDWEDGRPGNRTCSRCGTDQKLYYNRFPQIGEPQMFWEDWIDPLSVELP